jgi:hypothetical protein
MAMIRGFCLAMDQDTGQMCGRGMATYMDPERGCTACAKHYWEAEARRRARAAEVPESNGDRLALRLYRLNEGGER